MNSLRSTWLNRLASNSPVEFATIFAEFKACHSGVGMVTEGMETLAMVGVHQEAEQSASSSYFGVFLLLGVSTPASSFSHGPSLLLLLPSPSFASSPPTSASSFSSASLLRRLPSCFFTPPSASFTFVCFFCFSCFFCLGC